MWTHLELHSVKLEQVFEPFCAKALQFDRPWSIAELELAKDEVDWLLRWFSHLTPESMEIWFKSVSPQKIGSEMFVTSRQMLGALFICAGAEICREESSEDSVWPAIRRILPKSHALQGELFMSNGQPTFLTKTIISDAARALNLRNAMDIEGTQQWFVTIKLQFGFTRRGAENRLAEWLVNLGSPHAVQYLNGESEFPELISRSFRSLWKALTQYRQGLIDDMQVRDVLQSNPWVKSRWVDDLLKQAKAKIATLGTGILDIQPTDTDVQTEECCPLLDIRLKWPPNETPLIGFKLDRVTIEEQVSDESVTELDFYIDGSRICRWIRQRDGSWAGPDDIYVKPDNSKRLPNLNPQVFTIQTRSGNTLLEWDFSDSGLLDETIIFDLKNEKMLEVGFEQLQPNRSYAIVCDRDCEIQGCVPSETFEQNNIARKVVRLNPPLKENLCLTYGDFVLWQPLLSQEERKPRFKLTLQTPKTNNLSLNDKSELLLHGLPENAKSVELLIHKKAYEMRRFDGIWSTLEKITLDPKLAARQRRVRVRFQSEGQAFSYVPLLKLDLLGAAMLNQNNKGKELTFEALRAKTVVNLSQNTSSLWIWTPSEDNKSHVFEENYRVGKLRYGKIRLRDLAGHGGELQILSNIERYPLDIRCHDTGCVEHFLQSILGKDAQLSLFQDKSAEELGENGYSLFEWIVEKRGEAKLVRLADSCVQRSSTERLWQLRCRSNPLAIALTWKGAWLGSWWNLECIGSYIEGRRELRIRDFAVMKWLRTPVLDPTLVSVVKKAILSNPSHFLRAWHGGEGLPDGVEPHGNVLGIDSVIRYFLWNEFPLKHAGEATILADKWEKAHKDARWAHVLNTLSDISPILLWQGMKYYLRHHTSEIRGLLYSLIHVQTGLSSISSSGRQQLDYRLGELAKQTSRATGITGNRLDEILRARFALMKKNIWQPSEEHAADFLRLGETNAGRRYLSVRMVQYWLDIAEK